MNSTFYRFDFIWDATSKKSDLDYYQKMQKLAEGFMKYEGEYFYEAKVSFFANIITIDTYKSATHLAHFHR